MKQQKKTVRRSAALTLELNVTMKCIALLSSWMQQYNKSKP